MKDLRVIDSKLLHQIGQIVRENAIFKKQLNDIKIQNIAKDVAIHIDRWMDEPYESNFSEQQSIDKFSLMLTKYIDHRLKH